MKKFYIKNCKKALTAMLLTLLIGYSARATVTTLATLDSLSLATAITAAVTGDVIVLPTGTLKLIIAGNSFSVTNKILTFQAATGAKPVIGAIIKVGGTAVLPAGVIFNGIEFDQSFTPTNRNYVVQLSGTTVSRVQFINCNIHHVARSVVTGTTSGTQPLDSLLIDNSIFYTLGDGSSYWGVFTGGGTTSYLKGFKASNSTFIKLKGGIIKLSQCKNDTAQRISFNQCTIDSVYSMTTTLNPVIIKLNSSPTVPYTKVWSFNMTNCIMSNFYDFGTTGTTWGGIVIGANITGNVSNTRYFNISLNTGGTNNTITALTQTNTSVEDPQYSNPSWLMKDYTINNLNFLTASSTGGLIGDPRWAPLPSDATLKSLSFNGSSIFTPGVYKFGVTLPKGTTAVPNNSLFTYLKPALSTVVITQASGFNDSTSIKVTAQDASFKTYKIGFSVTPWSVSVASNPVAGGTATLAGGKTSYQPNEVATLSAVTNTGYHFVAWKNNTSGTNYSYHADTILTVTHDSSLVAVFALNISYTVSVIASPVAGGTATLAGGKTSYQPNEVATLSAVANTGYKFVSWKNNTSGTNYSYHADTTLTVTHDSSLVAVFVLKTYTVAVTASPVAGGTASLAGGKTSYQTNEVATLSAIANTGYNFVNWKNNTSGTNYSYHADTTLTVTKDSSLVAVFALKTFTVSAIASPVAGGTITGIPPAKVNYGTSVTFTAVPATGYSFVNWTKGATVLGTNLGFTFTATKDTAITANFLKLSIAVTSVTVTAAGNVTTISSKGGTSQMTATIAPANADNQNVTWSVDDAAKATISATGLLTAKADGTVTVTATSQDNTAIKGTLAITISGQATAVPSISMAEISVYPNPAADVIKITSELKSEVVIYNILGKVEIAKLVDANGTISIQNLKAGVYIVNIKAGSQVKTVRLLKQ